MKKLFSSSTGFLLGMLLPAVIVLAQTEQQAVVSSPRPDFTREEIRRQKQIEINAALKRDADWATARQEVEQQYGVALETIGLGKDDMLALKALLATRMMIPIEAREEIDRASSAPGRLAEMIEQGTNLVDEKIRVQVGVDHALAIAEIVRLGSNLRYIQSTYAPGIAAQATPLDAKQHLALARSFEAIQAKYQGETQEALIKSGLQDGLSPMSHELLEQASQYLTRDQLAALRGLMRTKMKESPIYNQLKKTP